MNRIRRIAAVAAVAAAGLLVAPSLTACNLTSPPTCEALTAPRPGGGKVGTSKTKPKTKTGGGTKTGTGVKTVHDDDDCDDD